MQNRNESNVDDVICNSDDTCAIEWIKFNSSILILVCMVVDYAFSCRFCV